MNVDKRTLDDLRNYLINCIEEKGLVEGKRSFSLQLGILENALFSEMEDIYPTIFNFAENAILEELPVVGHNRDALPCLTAVS